MNDATPLERAVILGARHGREAAEAWWSSLPAWAQKNAKSYPFDKIGGKPEPDLNGKNQWGICGTVLRNECGVPDADDVLYDQLVEAYEKAFHVLVEHVVKGTVDA